MNYRHPGTGDTEYGDIEHTVIEKLRAAMNGVADASFEIPCAYDIAERFLKEAFIANTHRRLATCRRSASHSQVALHTGIDTRAIGKVLNRPKKTSAPLISIEERIVKLWGSDPAFLHRETGQPARLPIYGPGQTFQRLVNRVARGTSPKAAINRLVANGAIQITGKFWVELKNPDWKPQLTQKQLDQFLSKLPASESDSATQE